MCVWYVVLFEWERARKIENISRASAVHYYNNDNTTHGLKNRNLWFIHELKIISKANYSIWFEEHKFDIFFFLDHDKGSNKKKDILIFNFKNYIWFSWIWFFLNTKIRRYLTRCLYRWSIGRYALCIKRLWHQIFLWLLYMTKNHKLVQPWGLKSQNFTSIICDARLFNIWDSRKY